MELAVNEQSRDATGAKNPIAGSTLSRSGAVSANIRPWTSLLRNRNVRVTIMLMCGIAAVCYLVFLFKSMS